MAVAVLQAVLDYFETVSLDDLSVDERLAMVIFANFANAQTGHAWPATATVMRKTGRSEKTARRVIGELRMKGLLTVIAPASQHRPAKYAVTLPGGQTGQETTPLAACQASQDAAPLAQGQTGQNGSPGVHAPAVQTGQEGAPDPLVNRQKEPLQRRSHADAEKFLRRYAALHFEHRGVKFPLQFKRQMPVIRELLNTYSLPQLENLAVAFLTLPPGTDSYIDRRGHDVDLFSSKVAWLDEQRAVHDREKQKAAQAAARQAAKDAAEEQDAKESAARRAAWRGPEGQTFDELTAQVGIVKAYQAYHASPTGAAQC